MSEPRTSHNGMQDNLNDFSTSTPPPRLPTDSRCLDRAVLPQKLSCCCSYAQFALSQCHREWLQRPGPGLRSRAPGGYCVKRLVGPTPVTTSVMVSVRTNSPLSVGSQWATVSVWKNPGSSSTSSPALRTVIEVRSKAPGLVVEIPLTARRSRSAFRYRSMVAALIASN